jgi:S-methylmethionine-dependent homocysteine/selenocysteine methylase
LSRYDALYQRIENGEKILINGATGTEVEIRGVPQLDNAWSGGAALTHPQIVKQIHKDYLAHSAEIIISNTFGTSYHALVDAGVEEQFEFLNRRGVELAVEARDEMGKVDALVAGGITHWSWTEQHPKLNSLKENAIKQAEIMKLAGADLIMLEMMVFKDRTVALMEAARTSGLPTWVGITCELDEKGEVRLYKGEPLKDTVEAIKQFDVPLINIMHTDITHIDRCLDALEKYWSGHVGVYAHGRRSVDNRWVNVGSASPDKYALASQRWLDRGVQIIGGCCGIGPKHIEVLRERISDLA